MIHGTASKLRFTLILVMLSLMAGSALAGERPRNEKWRLRGRKSVLELSKPERKEVWTARFEYFRQSPRRIFLETPVPDERAFELLLSNPDKELTYVDYKNDMLVTHYLEDISREEELKAFKEELGKYLVQDIPGFQSTKAYGRVQGGLWRRVASIAYFGGKPGRVNAVVGFADEANWDWEQDLSKALSRSLGITGCVFRKRFGNWVLEYDTATKDPSWKGGVAEWFSGPGRSIHVRIMGLKAYPKAVVEAYLEKYPSALTGDEKVDRKTWGLSYLRWIEEQALNRIDAPEEVRTRHTDWFHATLASSSRFEEGCVLRNAYEIRKKEIKDKYVSMEEGKYEFDKYWEELKELRRTCAGAVTELRERLENGDVRFDPGYRRLNIVEKQEEPDPGTAAGEEAPSEAVVSVRTVTYVLVGLGLVGVLAVAVYLLRRKRKSIN